jgi:hypothetical protein
LSQIEARFHVGDFHFSAYLKSSYNSQLAQENRLDMAEMVPRLVSSVEEARSKIKDVFRERASARAKTFVEGWKTSNVYPYEGEAANHLEKAERQIFDIVAVTVQEASNEFKDTPPKQQELATLLKSVNQHICSSPGYLSSLTCQFSRSSLQTRFKDENPHLSLGKRVQRSTKRTGMGGMGRPARATCRKLSLT